MRAIIIGAGPGGLTLAHGLRQAHIDTTVYEQDTPQGRPQGISLHLDDRGMTALHACLPADHVAMIKATTGGPRNRTLLLTETHGQLTITGQRPTHARPGHQVHRPLLREVMLTGLEDTVRFGNRLTRFKTLPNGTIQAHFTNGHTDTADVLIGADGIGSAVRRQYLPHARVIDTAKRVLMGATPLNAVPETNLPALIGDNPATIELNGTTMTLGILRYTTPPIDAARTWLPTTPPPAATQAQDYAMWALPVTQEHLADAQTPNAIWHRARALTTHLHPSLRSIINAAWPHVTVAHRIAMIPPLPPWPTTAVTLIGDAIHLAPGFGANLAMRDAHRLRDALTQASQGDQDLLTAIGSYEDTMRHDTTDAPRPHQIAEPRA